MNSISTSIVIVASVFAVACAPAVPGPCVEYKAGETYCPEGDSDSDASSGSSTSGSTTQAGTSTSTTSGSGITSGSSDSEATTGESFTTEVDTISEDPSDPTVSTTEPDPVCGNGIVEDGEECDDGNVSNDDECLQTCTLATCGDSYVHEGVESCDDGNSNTLDACPDCAVAVCGDGFVWEGVEVCDRGGTPEETGCASDCGGLAMRVFLSSGTYNGALGGIQGAHEKCQSLADEQPSLQLNGFEEPAEFRAWIAEFFVGPADYFAQNNGPYIRVDGEVVAESWDELVSGGLANPILATEKGALKPGSHAWTSVMPDGTGGFLANCNSWTLKTEQGKGRVGFVDETSSAWTLGGNDDCPIQNHLYCFEQPPG